MDTCLADFTLLTVTCTVVGTQEWALWEHPVVYKVDSAELEDWAVCPTLKAII
jgi:hypothetical protein